MAKPLVDVHCVTRPGCKYPVALKVAMEDGTVQEYTLNRNIEPYFNRSQDILAESIQISIGYQYRPRRKDRIHRCKR